MIKKEEAYTKTVREKIFRFYAGNTQECNRAYDKAMDNRIANMYSAIIEEKFQNILLTKTSIVILTANKFERNILHKRIYELTNQRITQFPIYLLTACEQYNEVYAYSFEWNNNTFLHIHANVTGSYTIGGSADIIRWIYSNKYLFPKLIISFGICFGTDNKNYEIGDVIISDKIYPYFIGAKIDKDKDSGEERITVVDDNAFKINSEIYNRIKNLINNNLFIPLPFQVKLKNYLTGEAVVSSQVARDAFSSVTTQDTPAGEMEGYGVFKECKCTDFNIHCLIIKSICDWGVEKNFNIEDENTLQIFKKMYDEKNDYISDEEVKTILSTLKDRLQAYAVNCAFTALKNIIETCNEDMSLFESLKGWLLHYNGAAITCKEIIDKARELAKKSNINCKPLNWFVHKSIIILKNEDKRECIEYAIQCTKDDENCHGHIEQVVIYKGQ